MNSTCPYNTGILDAERIFYNANTAILIHTLTPNICRLMYSIQPSLLLIYCVRNYSMGLFVISHYREEKFRQTHNLC